MLLLNSLILARWNVLVREHEVNGAELDEEYKESPSCVMESTAPQSPIHYWK